MLSWEEEVTYTRELRYEEKGESAFNQENSSEVKCRYQFVVKLKAIKCKKDVFYYLSSYIRLLTSTSSL